MQKEIVQTFATGTNLSLLNLYSCFSFWKI